LALITGSGPTAAGLFRDLAEADRAAASLPPRFAGAIVSAPQRYL
jgi:4-diphosphocytidyl-2C-methyl-D-erythritol kinase